MLNNVKYDIRYLQDLRTGIEILHTERSLYDIKSFIVELLSIIVELLSIYSIYFIYFPTRYGSGKGFKNLELKKFHYLFTKEMFFSSDLQSHL